jgi:hypothetical protein
MKKKRRVAENNDARHEGLAAVWLSAKNIAIQNNENILRLAIIHLISSSQLLEDGDLFRWMVWMSEQCDFRKYFILFLLFLAQFNFLLRLCE